MANSTCKTSNGVTIELGLRVFTNDWAWGSVVGEPSEYNPEWWSVKLDDDAAYCAGQTKTYDGDRMTTRAPAGAPSDPRK
jgi:hypothetical protein